MLAIAFWILLVTASFGALLALAGLGPRDDMPAFVAALRPRVQGFGLVHGGFGTVGLLVLLAALAWDDFHAPVGAAGFGRLAAWLAGGAFLLGLGILLRARVQHRKTALLIAAHASLAIAAVVVLMARVLIG